MENKKHVFYLCIPVAAELAGLIVSYLAPGNKSRGGEDFGIHGLLIVKTILECFVDGAKQIFLYLFKTPFILLCLVVIAVLLVNAFQKVRPTFDFPYPVIVAVAMFCMYCAMYAPGVYAGVKLSGGVPNTIYQVIIPRLFEPPVRILRATLPDGGSHCKLLVLLNADYSMRYLL